MPTPSSSLLRPLAALAVTGVLVLSGCGGDDDEPTASTSAGGTTTAAGAGTTTDAAGASGTTTGGGDPSGGATAGGASGGGASGGPAGGGDEATYVRTLEGICKKVAQDSQRFVSDITRLGTAAADDESIEPLKAPMTRFFDAVGRSYQQLAAAQAPDKWASYQASLRGDADGVAKYLDEAKDLLNDADSPADLQKLQQLMGRTSFNTGDAPKDLAAKTPSCSPRGAASGAAGSASGARTVTTPAP